MLPSKVIFSILLVLTFCHFIEGAGGNDNIFDWLKDDDHIISNQDLHFLQQHHSHQGSSQHNNSPHASPQHNPPHSNPQYSSPNANLSSAGISSSQQENSETRGIKRRRGGSEEQAKPRTEQVKQRRNELERQRLKNWKNNNPIGYKSFRAKRNEEDKVRRQNMSTEQKKHLWGKQYKSKKRNDPPRPLTLEDHNKKLELNRERRMRYESNLSTKILNNQATDKQINTYRKEFGIKRHKDLMKKKD